MAEQQLVDYIQKAKAAGQSEIQIRSVLLKNGWTDAEVSDAFAALNPQEETKIQPRYQPQPQPAQAQASSVNMQSNMPRRRGPAHTLLKLLSVLIIIVVLAGAGYFVAGKYFNLNLPFSLNFFNPDPKTVLSKMELNMANAKLYHSVVNAEISLVNNNVSSGKITLNAGGDNDTTDSANPKANLNFSANLASPNGSFDATANAVVAGADLYISLSKLSATGFVVPADLSVFLQKWYKVDQDSIKALAATQGAGINVPDVSQQNSLNMVKQIQDIITGENLLSFNKQLSDETVSGQQTFHYLMTISKEKLSDFLSKIISATATQAQSTPGANQNTASAFAMAQSFVTPVANAIGDVNVEVWIGKNDYMLYRFKIDKVIDLTKAIPTVAMQIGLKLDTIYSNFNKPFTVQIPASSQKIEDVILPLLKTQTKNSAVDLDLRRFSAWAETIFSKEKSYSSLCANGLLNGYQKDLGEDLIGLHRDIIAQGGSKPRCFASTNNYCVSTEIDGEVLCAGSSLVFGSVTCSSASTVCK